MTTKAPGAQSPPRPNQSCSNCDKKLSGFLHGARHQCRMCGEVFCSDCTDQKALIPPSSIALGPTGIGSGAGEKGPLLINPNLSASLFQSDNDCQELPKQQMSLKLSPDRRHSRGSYLPIDTIAEHEEGEDLESYVTDDTFLSDEEELMRVSLGDVYPTWGNSSFETGLSLDTTSIATSSDLSYANSTSARPSQRNQQDSQVHLYGRGLEERMKLAREPLRVCLRCHSHLQHLQEELRNCNSNAMKYNSINPTGMRRLLNSPMAFTLGHEVRKAAYTLSNLLPMPKRMGAFEPFDGAGELDEGGDSGCTDNCGKAVGNFSNVDGVKIPATLLEQARGVAFLTVIKGGMGFTGFEFGTGLVVSRLPDETWSPPCAIGTAGISWGALVGVQLSDHVLLLMTDNAVDVLSSNDGSVRLGADIGVALGPLGRTVEADVGSGGGVALAPIYTYSLSKGFYMGASFDGKVIITRHDVNEKFYGQRVDARALLRGDVPTPPAAQPLYDALKRCHAYASCSV